MKKRKKTPHTRPKAHAPPAREAGEISGLPPSLPQGTLAALVENGTVIALASGDTLTTFRVESGPEYCSARTHTSRKLPGRATALAESNLGLLVAVVDCEHAAIYLAGENHLAPICEAPGTVMALVAAGAHAYAVVQTGPGLQARLLRIDVRQRKVIAERPLDHSQMKLSIDLAGQQLVVTDADANRVHVLGPNLEPLSAAGASPAPGEYSGPQPSGSEGNPHPRGCCCMVCLPAPPDPQTPGAPG
jgi:hypothetical protein